jgi:hypothetical protein
MNNQQECSMYTVMKYLQHILGATLLILPALSFAASDLLLNEADLAAKIGKEPNYQLLDARSAEARRSVPLAFSTRYEKAMPIKKGLVFVVADSDASAVEIAQSIPVAGSDCGIFAVQGGADAWKRVQAKTATAVAPAFVVPKGTCELGAPSMKIDAKPGNKTGKTKLEPINK